MLIVIPLSLSSGATSILSKSTFSASPLSDNTLDIAAVVVVLVLLVVLFLRHVNDS